MKEAKVEGHKSKLCVEGGGGAFLAPVEGSVEEKAEGAFLASVVLADGLMAVVSHCSVITS